MVEPLNFNFRVFTVKVVGVRKFRNFKVIFRHKKKHVLCYRWEEVWLWFCTIQQSQECHESCGTHEWERNIR